MSNYDNGFNVLAVNNCVMEDLGRYCAEKTTLCIPTINFEKCTPFTILKHNMNFQTSFQIKIMVQLNIVLQK